MGHLYHTSSPPRPEITADEGMGRLEAMDMCRKTECAGYDKAILGETEDIKLGGEERAEGIRGEGNGGRTDLNSLCEHIK